MNIELIRKICLALPAVTEDIKWGNDLVFSVGGKMFCVSSADEPIQCSFKVPVEQYEELTIRPGFVPAPYLARANWVLITEPSKASRSEWQEFISQSYELVKAKLTKKIKTELNLS